MPTFALSRFQHKPKDIARIVLGVFFIGASFPHFISDVELSIIPRFLPWRRAALYISGVCELLGGIGVLIPRFQRAAGWGLTALLVAIFPANIYHTIQDIQSGRFAKTRIYHLVRPPLQGILIWWTLWCTGKEK